MEIGSVIMYGTGSTPTGWLLCDGASYDTTTQAALFLVTGYVYGGSGSNFNVPDLRGRMALAAGSGVGLTTRSLADSGGQEKITDVPEHLHVNEPACANAPGNKNSPAGNLPAADGTGFTADYHITLHAESMKAWNSENTGVAGGVDVMDPFLTLNFIIKAA